MKRSRIALLSFLLLCSVPAFADTYSVTIKPQPSVSKDKITQICDERRVCVISFFLRGENGAKIPATGYAKFVRGGVKLNIQSNSRSYVSGYGEDFFYIPIGFDGVKDYEVGVYASGAYGHKSRTDGVLQRSVLPVAQMTVTVGDLR